MATPSPTPIPASGFCGRLSAPVRTVAIATLTLLAVTGCTAPRLDTPAAELLTALPQGSMVLGFYDYDRVDPEAWLFPEGQERGLPPGTPESILRLVRETGIELWTDVHGTAFSFAVDEEHGPGAVLVADVTFDRQRVVDAFDPWPRFEYRDREVWRIDLAAELGGLWTLQRRDRDRSTASPDTLFGIDGAAYVVLFAESGIALGTRGGVLAALDAVAGSPSVVDNSEMMALANEASAAGPHWTVASLRSIVEYASPRFPERRARPSFLDSMSSVLVASDYTGGGFRGVAKLRTDSADTARLQADLLRGGVSMLKIQLQSEAPELYVIIDRSLSVISEDIDVIARWDIGAEDMETLQQWMVERMDDSDGFGRLRRQGRR